MAERPWAAEAHRASRVSSCRRRGCTLDLRGLVVDDLTIIDCDLADHLFVAAPQPERVSKRPDYILFFEQHGQVVVVVVEMKSGANTKAKEVLEQVTAGCRAVELMIAGNAVRAVVPMLVHGGMDSSRELSYLRMHGVRCVGSGRPVVSVRCGARLEPALRRLLAKVW